MTKVPPGTATISMPTPSPRGSMNREAAALWGAARPLFIDGRVFEAELAEGRLRRLKQDSTNKRSGDPQAGRGGRNCGGSKRPTARQPRRRRHRVAAHGRMRGGRNDSCLGQGDRWPRIGQRDRAFAKPQPLRQFPNVGMPAGVASSNPLRKLKSLRSTGRRSDAGSVAP